MKVYYSKEVDDKYYRYKYIHGAKVFGDLIKYGHIEVFDRNEKIIKYNRDVEHLHFLISGKAKIYMIHEDGKQSLIQFLNSGDFIGELTLLGVEDTPKDVVAISECICLSFPLISSKDELLLNNDFLQILCKYIGKKMLKRTEMYAKNQNYELKNRLASYILLTEYNGIYCEKHTETAEFLGVSYRHLLYTFQQFVKDQFITKQKVGYLIDYEKLRNLSEDVNFY